MMYRSNIVFYGLVAVLIMFSRAVFSQAPGMTGGAPPADQQSEMNAGSSGPGNPQTGGGAAMPGGQAKDQVMTITDEIDPNSPNQWDRIRDVFRPYTDVAAVNAGLSAASATAEAAKTHMPTLQGVLTSSDNDKVAVLDDQFARPGDFCDGFEVKKINKGTVVLKRDGKEFVLYVKQ